MADEARSGIIVGGRYELLEIAGRGGMADVWRGRVRGDSGFVRDVAVKQMHSNLASQPPYVAMFVEEARIGSCLQSPNVAEVHDFVHDRGNYYMVLEWIEGLDLGTWIKWHANRKEHARWELVAAVGVGILRGLAAAHERVGADGRTVPVVHRDVSPHNVLLTTRGMVKLIDFGLALAPDRAQETTDPGIVKGKMSYLAPEIVAGGRPSPASDQFACGSVLYEALVGRKLFEGQTDYETYTRLRDCQVPPLRGSRPDVPQQFTAILHRALMAQPEQRFPSTREMARQIGQALKKVQLRKDLHTVLSKTVADAREQLGIAAVGDHSEVTPIVELTPPQRMTPSKPVPVVAPPPVHAETAHIEKMKDKDKDGGKGMGLLHRLPTLFGFGRKRG
jgi:serine/threonine-protein kinase|nr:serine/threonine-protein kinase [Kofleriaceae bacterium]